MKTQDKKRSGFLSFLGLGKPNVSDDAIALHEKNFQKLDTLASRSARIDNEKFTNQEFVFYIYLMLIV